MSANSSSAPGATPPPVLTCTSCGGENAVNSRFCQHCGTPLALAGPDVAAADGKLDGQVPATVMAPPSAVASTIPTPETVTPSANPAAAPPSVAPTAPAASTAPAAPIALTEPVVAVEENHRRARLLLDKALVLSERGDLDGAIHSCNQAVGLDPSSSAAFSMLGLLWERAGENAKAIQAYERALQLAPDSLLERESLQRLRSSVPRSVVARNQHPPATALAVASTAAIPAARAADSGSVAVPLPAVTQPSATPSNMSSAVAGVNTPAVTLPLATPPIRVLTFADDPQTSSRFPQQWQALLRQPSFYFRAAPLSVTTIIGLAFLMWAQSWATSNRVGNPTQTGETAQIVSANSVDAAPADQGPATTTDSDVAAAATKAPSTNGGTGFVVQNFNAPNAKGGAAPAGSAGGGGTASGGESARHHPVRRGSSASGGGGFVAPPMPSVAPAEPPANLAPAPPHANSTDNVQQPASTEHFPVMPPPSIPSNRGTVGGNGEAPAAPSPVIIPSAPASDTASSEASSSSSGSTARGYIRRVQPQRVAPERVAPSAAPARPENQAATVEQSAYQDARSGRTDRAINRISQLLSEGGDTGYRYQQRASMFLDRGDYSRAADDYQAAIAAYNDQLRRGERMPQARNGIEAARNGLRVALAALRH